MPSHRALPGLPSFSPCSPDDNSEFKEQQTQVTNERVAPEACQVQSQPSTKAKRVGSRSCALERKLGTKRREACWEVDSKARGPAATRGLDGCVVERPGERAVGGRGILCVPRMALNLQTSSAHGSTGHFLHGICHCLVPLQVTGGCVLPSNTDLVPKTS